MSTRTRYGAMLDQDFRDAMRRLAATVNVITIQADGRPLGMVATAVSSLSAAPPSVLVCVNESASIHDRLVATPYFCVNVLHQDHQGLARVFADSRTRESRFGTGSWDLSGTAPCLMDAQAVLLCERSEQLRFATHTICIGLVCEVRLRSDVDPLLWVDGQFRKAG